MCGGVPVTCPVIICLSRRDGSLVPLSILVSLTWEKITIQNLKYVIVGNMKSFPQAYVLPLNLQPVILLLSCVYMRACVCVCVCVYVCRLEVRSCQLCLFVCFLRQGLSLGLRAY